MAFNERQKIMKIRIGLDTLALLISLYTSENIYIPIACLVCAILHEIGHLLAARLLNIPIREISISVGGAKIYPRSYAHSYISEIVMCSAGPAVNAMTAVFAALIGNTLDPASESCAPYTDMSFLSYIFIFSILQLLLNMLPIKDLDGGRIIHCLISQLFSQRAGKQVIFVTTILFSLLMWTASVYFMIRNGGGISLFVFSLCMLAKTFEC